VFLDHINIKNNYIYKNTLKRPTYIIFFGREIIMASPNLIENLVIQSGAELKEGKEGRVLAKHFNFFYYLIFSV